MGLIRRINALVLAHIGARSGELAVLKVQAMHGSLSLALENGEQQVLDLQRLQRAVAARRDSFGGEIALLLHFDAPTQLVQIPESCQGWQEVCAVLDAMPGSTPQRLWYPSVLAAGGETSSVVWTAAVV